MWRVNPPGVSQGQPKVKLLGNLQWPPNSETRTSNQSVTHCWGQRSHCGNNESLLVFFMYVVTPILEDLRLPQNLQNWRFCILYAKSLKSDVLRPLQKLHNRTFCVVFKILILCSTPKSELVLHNHKVQFSKSQFSKIGGFATTAKTPKSEVLRSFKNIMYFILQNQRFCVYDTQKFQK